MADNFFPERKSREEYSRKLRKKSGVTPARFLSRGENIEIVLTIVLRITPGNFASQAVRIIQLPFFSLIAPLSIAVGPSQ